MAHVYLCNNIALCAHVPQNLKYDKKEKKSQYFTLKKKKDGTVKLQGHVKPAAMTRIGRECLLRIFFLPFWILLTHFFSNTVSKDYFNHPRKNSGSF